MKSGLKYFLASMLDGLISISVVCYLLSLPHHHYNCFFNCLRPFFRDQPVPEEKGRLTEADTLTIRLGATPSGLTSAHLHHPALIHSLCQDCYLHNLHCSKCWFFLRFFTGSTFCCVKAAFSMHCIHWYSCVVRTNIVNDMLFACAHFHFYTVWYYTDR